MLLFKINLTARDSNVVPFNYNAHLARALQAILLRNLGSPVQMCCGSLSFKRPFQMDSKRSGIINTDAELRVGMLTTQSLESVSYALINQFLVLPGGGSWVIKSINSESLPKRTPIRLKTDSPILIRASQEGLAHQSYLLPDHELYHDLLVDSIYQKWLQWSGGHRLNVEAVQIKIEKWSTKLILINEEGQVKVRCIVSVQMHYSGPVELLHTALCGGVGHITQLGLGMLSVK